MTPASAHAHSHPDVTGGRLRIAFLLTASILAVELAAGFLAGSLALLADAGHVVTDAVALGLAWFSVAQARRPADERRTYGYHRVGILAALANGVTLVAIVAAIAFEAFRRLQRPEPVEAGLVVLAAVLAIVANGYIALSLRGSGGGLNVRAALVHVLGDLGASVGVLIAGSVILLTGWLWVDPVLSLGIAGLIAFSAWGVVHRTVHILLEGTPTGMDLAAVRAEIEGVPGVESVHDLHVWSLGSEERVLSCHVVVSQERLADAEHTMRELESHLCHGFGIGHTTIQLESCHPCASDDAHGPGEHNHPHAAGSTHAHGDGRAAT